MAVKQNNAAAKDSPLKKRTGGGILQKYMVIIVWAVLIVFFSLISNEFFKWSTVSLILGTRSIIVVLALAILIPITAGDYDMSAGAVMTMANMIVGYGAVELGLPLWLVCIIALVAGALVGVINGAFTVLLGIDPFIVTMGMGTFLEGVVLWISNKTIAGTELSPIAKGVVRKLGGIQYIFFYGVILTLIIWYIFEFTSVGKKILFVGRGKDVARLSGIKTEKVRWGCLIASASLSALAGVLYTGITSSANATSCTGFQMPAFAAVFLGSTCIKPGRFNPIGCFIAVYFLETGIKGLQLLGAQTWIQNVFYGAALVLAVAVAEIVKRRQEKVAKAALKAA